MTEITVGTISDAERILALQRLAYQSEARLYDDDTIPPLTQSLEDLRTTFRDHLFLVATVDGELVGSVRACPVDGTVQIGRLIVHPDYQKRGIGTNLMRQIEASFPSAKRFDLFTGHKSEGNLRLYARLAYREYRRETVTPQLTLVFLEKLREE